MDNDKNGDDEPIFPRVPFAIIAYSYNPPMPFSQPVSFSIPYSSVYDHSYFSLTLPAIALHNQNDVKPE